LDFSDLASASPPLSGIASLPISTTTIRAENEAVAQTAKKKGFWK